MYTVIGMEIVDSEEIKEEINKNSLFKVEVDMTKATKREDVLAYKLKINIDELKKIIDKSEDYKKEETKNLNEDELFDIYMDLSEKLTKDLEKLMPQYTIMKSRSYKLDLSENCIKTVIVVSHADLGLIKLTDVLKRSLSQVD